jgi:DNA-binding transcriptional LysR family regulator
MIVDTLRVFVTVAELRSFSRAAAILHISQPAVTLQIKNLENEFGMKLIHRTTKRVELTQAGKIVYDRAVNILRMYDETKQEVMMLRNVISGKLKIGASFTIGEYILPRILAEFAGQYPQVETEVNIANTNMVVHEVRSGSLDLGLVEGEVSDEELRAEPYMDDELVFIFPPHHPLAMQHEITVEDLNNQVWILRESGSGTRYHFDRFQKEQGLAAKRCYVFGSSQGVKEAVAEGLGIALLSRWTLLKELAAREIVALPVKDVRILRQFFIISRQDADASKAYQVFKEKLLMSREQFLAELELLKKGFLKPAWKHNGRLLHNHHG